jgi:F-type H+-transporting ATPase subunit epsilon
MLSVRGGELVSVATPEAVAGDDLQALEADVLSAFRRQLSEEQASRIGSQRLYLAAIRQIVRFLRPRQTPSLQTATSASEIGTFES